MCVCLCMYVCVNVCFVNNHFKIIINNYYEQT